MPMVSAGGVVSAQIDHASATDNSKAEKWYDTERGPQGWRTTPPAGCGFQPCHSPSHTILLRAGPRAVTSS